MTTTKSCGCHVSVSSSAQRWSQRKTQLAARVVAGASRKAACLLHGDRKLYPACVSRSPGWHIVAQHDRLPLVRASLACPRAGSKAVRDFAEGSHRLAIGREAEA